MPKNQHKNEIKIRWIWGGVGVLLLIGVSFLVLYTYVKQGTMLPLGLFALIGGLLYKSYQVNRDFWLSFTLVVVSLLFSLLGLIPSAKEFEVSIIEGASKVPLYFIFIYSLFTVVFNYDKLLPRLHEGITFLQSLALLYLLIEVDLFTSRNMGVWLLLLLAVAFFIYASYHAFTQKKHSKNSRFILSIWSTIVYAFFAVLYLLDFIFVRITFSDHLTWNGVLILIQYFLLGVSLLYILHNFFMIISFFPGRGSFFNKIYFQEIREAKQQHISRYDTNQQSLDISVLSLLFAVVLFGFNYVFKLVQPELVIWMLFFSFPLILNTYLNLKNKIIESMFFR